MTPRTKFLTAGEAAELLGVDRRTVSRWCEAKRLAAHRTAGGDVRKGEWRIAPAAVAELKRRTTNRREP